MELPTTLLLCFLAAMVRIPIHADMMEDPVNILPWFRNETTFVVFITPPKYKEPWTDFKVTLDPPDADESDVFIPKVGTPPAPRQMEFHNLYPGREYNVSVELVFEYETSEPGSSILYRILPLSPTNVTVSTDIFPDDLTPANASFTVTWDGPDSDSDFDRFLVKLPKQNITQLVELGEPQVAVFNKSITPGETFQVFVKTVSGTVSSWPAVFNFTIPPLPPQDINMDFRLNDEGKRGLFFAWLPLQGTWIKRKTNVTANFDEWFIHPLWRYMPSSIQDSYKVEYFEFQCLCNETADVSKEDVSKISEIIVKDIQVEVNRLQPDRRFSFFVSVKAISNGIESKTSQTSECAQPRT